MKGGSGLGNCSQTRPVSYFRPAVAVVALLVVALAAGLAGWSGRSAGPSEAAAGDENYPRLLIIQELSGAGKYHAMVGIASWISNVADLKADLASEGRSISALRYFAPRQYQNDVLSIPLNEIYAGHWLFLAGTTTTTALTSTATSIPVASTGPFSGLAGYFAMIWDGKAVNPALTPNDPAFWANAEHVKITAVGSGSVTVQRGYNPSTQSFSSGLARSHANGSRIAVHVPGAYTGPEIWSLNQSTASPRDPQGRQLNQVLATWVGQHLQHLYNKGEGTYRSYPGAWDGVWFDATEYWIDRTQPPSDKADVNNDLVVDGGILTPGRSAWGEGLDVFYDLAHQALGPNKITVGGVMTARGAAYLNGVDLEGFPGSGHSSSNYRVYSTALATYLAWDTGSGYSPPFTDLFTRIGTNKYAACSQFGHTTEQGHNSDFRFGLGSTLLGQGYFVYTNGCFGDYWWDEYSVNLTTGIAVPVSAGLDALAASTGYLGQPVGDYQRLLNPTSGANLMTGGSWTVQTSGGAAATRTVNGATVTVNITSPGNDPGNITLQYGPVSLVSGQEYTLSFWGKADNGRMGIDLVRELNIAAGNGGGALGGATLTGSYRQYFIDFVSPTTTSNTTVRFLVGGEGGTVWVDQAGLYQGASDLFRRDFGNGIVVVNGTWQQQTVALGANFRKILGTQDPAFNNGATVSSVTLAPHDAIILLRTGPAPTPTRTATPGGQTSTPTRTPTRTATPAGPTPTRTPTRTATPVGPTPTPTPAGATDLGVVAMQDPPASASAGGAFDAACTNKNFGPDNAGPSTTRHYLSQDTAKGGGDVTLAPDHAVPALPAGEQSWEMATVTIPDSAPSGTYYLLVCADDANVIAESNEGNNCRASGSTMQVSGGSAPDLRVVAMQDPPASVNPGDTLEVADTTRNFGPGAAGPSITRYYLSQDTAKSAGDVALTPDRALSALEAGAQSWGTVTATIPESTPGGTYYLLACADDADLIPETDEGNNCSQEGPMVLSGPPLESEDSDGDGCTAYEEAFGAPPPMPGSTCTSPASCYSDSTWYDSYDVPVPANPDPAPNGSRDKAVSLGDAAAVLFYLGASPSAVCGDNGNGNGVDYDCDKNGDGTADGRDFDRSPGLITNPPWDAGPPDGAISFTDVGTVLMQIGLDCSGPP